MGGGKPLDQPVIVINTGSARHVFPILTIKVRIPGIVEVTSEMIIRARPAQGLIFMLPILRIRLHDLSIQPHAAE
jgi:hypothetical protein